MNLHKGKDCSAISKDGGSRKISIAQSDGNIQPHTYNVSTLCSESHLQRTTTKDFMYLDIETSFQALEATIEETATEDSKVSTDMIVLETRTCTPGILLITLIRYLRCSILVILSRELQNF